MKILEICPYSAGVCGVWQRAKQESEELVKRGYDVTVFSSNITKGTNKIAKKTEIYNGVKIYRFPAKKVAGESFMIWDYTQKALKLQPNIIIVHNYRHLHTTLALKIKRKLKKCGILSKVFLVTHAPFIPKNTTRSKLEEFVVLLYDKFIGKHTLNKFDYILPITKWEIPLLKKIGCKKEKICRIPNFVPNIFFKDIEIIKKNLNILFLGRIAPVKDINTLINATKNTKYKISLIGNEEIKYKQEIINKINNDKIRNIRFYQPIYNITDKINIYDNNFLFILPSKREALGQVIIEAMARGKIIISSNTDGGKELIKDGINGFLFHIGNSKQLKEKIDLVYNLNNKEIKKISLNAIKTAKEYSAKKSIDKLERLFYD